MSGVRVIQRSVNSKMLFEELNETIYEAITTLGVRWSNDQNRNSFVEVLEDFLNDKFEEGKIEQYKVICDKRNNGSFSPSFKGSNEYLLEVFYRQPHCLNTSKIQYFIKR